MNEMAVAVAIFCGIIGVQYAIRLQRQLRMKRLWQRAGAALQAGNFEDAEATLRQCVDSAPLALPVRTALANVLMRLGRMEEAETQFKAVASLQPRQAEGHLQLGYFYVTQLPGREAEAIAAFAAALEHAPQLRTHYQNDPRLDPLRGLPGFQSLLSAPAERR